jgi:hypothetical protein
MRVSLPVPSPVPARELVCVRVCHCEMCVFPPLNPCPNLRQTIRPRLLKSLNMPVPTTPKSSMSVSVSVSVSVNLSFLDSVNSLPDCFFLLPPLCPCSLCLCLSQHSRLYLCQQPPFRFNSPLSCSPSAPAPSSPILVSLVSLCPVSPPQPLPPMSLRPFLSVPTCACANLSVCPPLNPRPCPNNRQP